MGEGEALCLDWSLYIKGLEEERGGGELADRHFCFSTVIFNVSTSRVLLLSESNCVQECVKSRMAWHGMTRPPWSTKLLFLICVIMVCLMRFVVEGSEWH